MTTLSADDFARDQSLQPQLVWTCDADGNWHQERRFRTRVGNGWREIHVLDATEIYNRIMADGASIAKLDAAILKLRTAR